MLLVSLARLRRVNKLMKRQERQTYTECTRPPSPGDLLHTIYLLGFIAYLSRPRPWIYGSGNVVTEGKDFLEHDADVQRNDQVDHVVMQTVQTDTPRINFIQQEPTIDNCDAMESITNTRNRRNGEIPRRVNKIDKIKDWLIAPTAFARVPCPAPGQ